MDTTEEKTQAQEDGESKEASPSPEDGKKKDEGKKFSQADVDRMFADFKKREKEKLEKDASDKKEQARIAAMEANNEHAKLAEEHKRSAELAEARAKAAEEQLESHKAEQDRLKALISEDVKAQLAALKIPQYYQDLLDKMDPIEQRAFLSKNREEMAKSTPSGLDRLPNADPNGHKMAKKEEATKAAEREYRARF